MPKSACKLAVCLCALAPAVALAALGDLAQSIELDRAQLNASARIVTAPRYTVYELAAPGGTIVREFVAPSGIVFAIAWRGPFMPDLRQALGAYFEPYQSAVRTNSAGHGQVSVAEPDLVVNSGGHQRAFFGQAYLPQALPPGVSSDELR
jgi:hypothetical protein